jgi:hypothetical protein
MQGGNCMDADRASAKSVIAASPAPDGDAPDGSAANGDASNCSPSDRQKDANGSASYRDKAEGASADGHDAAREASASEPARRHVAEGEYAAGMAAHLARLQIGTDGNIP